MRVHSPLRRQVKAEPDHRQRRDGGPRRPRHGVARPGVPEAGRRAQPRTSATRRSASTADTAWRYRLHLWRTSQGCQRQSTAESARTPGASRYMAGTPGTRRSRGGAAGPRARQRAGTSATTAPSVTGMATGDRRFAATARTSIARRLAGGGRRREVLDVTPPSAREAGPLVPRDRPPRTRLPRGGHAQREEPPRPPRGLRLGTTRRPAPARDTSRPRRSSSCSASS